MDDAVNEIVAVDNTILDDVTNKAIMANKDWVLYNQLAELEKLDAANEAIVSDEIEASCDNA